MDVEDFTRKVKPHHKRSRLETFRAEIRDLKNLGYSDMQIRDWLAQNGISVSRENVRKFIKRHLIGQDIALEQIRSGNTSMAAGTNQAEQAATVATSPAQARQADDSAAARMQRLAREQKNEAKNTLFRHDKSGNNH